MYTCIVLRCTNFRFLKPVRLYTIECTPVMYSVHPGVGLCTVVCTVCNLPRVGGITSGQNWFIQIGQTNGGVVAPASVATLQSFVLSPMAL